MVAAMIAIGCTDDPESITFDAGESSVLPIRTLADDEIAALEQAMRDRAATQVGEVRAGDPCPDGIEDALTATPTWIETGTCELLEADGRDWHFGDDLASYSITISPDTNTLFAVFLTDGVDTYRAALAAETDDDRVFGGTGTYGELSFLDAGAYVRADQFVTDTVVVSWSGIRAPELGSPTVTVEQQEWLLGVLYDELLSFIRS